jgi:uncharacterized protein YggE
MKLFAPALTALLLAAAPALAGSVIIDLPHLTWPDNGTQTGTPDCAATTLPAPTCKVSH